MNWTHALSWQTTKRIWTLLSKPLNCKFWFNTTWLYLVLIVTWFERFKEEHFSYGSKQFGELLVKSIYLMDDGLKHLLEIYKDKVLLNKLVLKTAFNLDLIAFNLNGNAFVVDGPFDLVYIDEHVLQGWLLCRCCWGVWYLHRQHKAFIRKPIQTRKFHI